LLGFMTNGINKFMSLLPQDVDSDNYIPLLNSFALAALNEKVSSKNKSLLNPFYTKNQKLNFKESGIEIFSNATYFSILNYKKGGTLKVFDLRSKKCIYDSGGLIYFNSKKIYTSQKFDNTIILDHNGVFKSFFYVYEENFPKQFQTILIRLLSKTIFNISFFRELFKKIIVKILITKKRKTRLEITTSIKYESNSLIIKYNFNKKIDNKKLISGLKFKAIHMASSGYLNKSNIGKSDNNIVKEIVI